MRVHSMNREEKVAYMLSETIPHLICEMAVPTIISMLVTSFYNMADTFTLILAIPLGISVLKEIREEE